MSAKAERELRKILQDEGFTAISIEPCGSGHLKIRATLGTITITATAAKTASDHRNLKNFRRDIREAVVKAVQRQSTQQLKERV